jgi:hypothetical protein
MVLCNGHVPTGGLMHDGNPLLDFNAFPSRIMETPDKPQEAILKLGFSDGIYNKSKGGRTFSGWTCDHLPYLVELDNYGVSRHPGQPNEKGNFIWVWGYDEITWFAHQTKDYRAKWLQYAWDWVRTTDPNGYLEMPGSRTATSRETRWYFANDPALLFQMDWATKTPFAPSGGRTRQSRPMNDRSCDETRLRHNEGN